MHIALLWISCNVSRNDNDLVIFRINSLTGITSLDPAYAQTQENIRYVNQLFNGLVSLDDSLKVIPAIAKNWEISENGKVYKFIIKDSVFFHKSDVFGARKTRKVTAHDFVYSFTRLMDENTASDGSWIFNNIISENAFRAKNDSTFEIHLIKSHAPLLSLLTMSYCFVVPKEGIDKYGKNFGQHPIGTGPFLFANWQSGVRLNFIKNENYFNKEQFKNSNLDAISVSFIESSSLALLSFLQGKIDVFTGLESAFKDELLEKNGSLKINQTEIALITKPFLNTEYLAFRLSEKTNSSDHLKLRKAINHAIDREQMVAYFRNHLGTPAKGGFVPFGLMGYSELDSQLFNTELAKKLVSECQENNFPTTLELYTTKEYADLAILIQKSCKDVGIDITIEVLSSAIFKERKNQGDLTFFRGSWIADYPNCENYFSCFYGSNKSPKGPNYTHFENTEFDRLYEQLLKSTNANDVIHLAAKMEQILSNEVPIIVLFYDMSSWFVRKNIKNLGVNSLNHLDLSKVTKS
jgi:peptide/nickel transport system substrate-binding protein